ncbi:MAG TPA: hypothetical protein ENJ29_05545 [Bacteroidetes bacterium]|nr:hypothetical protein [Bacteroidota bacterium]
MLQNEITPHSIIAELDHHYASLEKLHSIVMSEYFALSQNELDFIPELSKTKNVVLKELDDKRHALQAWRNALAVSQDDLADGILPVIQKPVKELKHLLRMIMHIERNNAHLIEQMKKKVAIHTMTGVRDAD